MGSNPTGGAMHAHAHIVPFETVPDTVLRWDFYWNDAVYHMYWWDEFQFGLYLGVGRELHNWQFIQLASEA